MPRPRQPASQKSFSAKPGGQHIVRTFVFVKVVRCAERICFAVGNEITCADGSTAEAELA
jgi:hypothetical protein